MFDVTFENYELKKSSKMLCFKVSYATCVIIILNKTSININTFRKM